MSNECKMRQVAEQIEDVETRISVAESEMCQLRLDLHHLMCELKCLARGGDPYAQPDELAQAGYIQQTIEGINP